MVFDFDRPHVASSEVISIKTTVFVFIWNFPCYLWLKLELFCVAVYKDKNTNVVEDKHFLDLKDLILIELVSKISH